MNTQQLAWTIAAAAIGTLLALNIDAWIHRPTVTIGQVQPDEKVYF